MQGRIVGATEEEINSAVATFLRALAHPLLRRAAAAAGSGGLRREIPVLLNMDDGSLVEGVVDLAFRISPAGPWWILRPIASLKDPLIVTLDRCNCIREP